MCLVLMCTRLFTQGIYRYLLFIKKETRMNETDLKRTTYHMIKMDIPFMKVDQIVQFFLKS